VADNYATESALDMQLKLDDAFKNWQNDNKSNPVNATTKINDYMKPVYDEYLNNAPNDQAKAKIKSIGDRQMLRYTLQGKRWENNTIVDNTRQTTLKANESIALSSYNQGNDLGIQQGLNQYDAALVNYKNVANQDDFIKAQAAGRSKIAVEGITGAIDQGRFNDAAALIVKYQEDIGVDNVQRLSAVNARRKEAKLKVAAKAMANKFKKQWQYLDDMKETVGLKPIDVMKSAFDGTVTNDFEERLAFTTEMTAKHRMNEVPIMTENEANQFLADFNNQAPDRQDIIMNNLSKNMSDEVLDEFANQVFKKSPDKAVAFSLYEDDPKTSREIIEGGNILKT
jgi:hypothetical protein